MIKLKLLNHEKNSLDDVATIFYWQYYLGTKSPVNWYLRPIPQEMIDVTNPKIEQNPGY
ncbi:MAG TPA: hypothetical protein DEB23_10040 [Chitinophagaceae bacterium]|nr:hypothetical protein [Chitinophagaceae bacterium]